MTPTNLATPGIERRLELRAAPDRVWRALTDERELASWFSQRADLQPQLGSIGWLEWDGHGRFAIRIESIEPETYLAWRWMNGPNAEIDDSATLVEWRLTPAADGGTILDLRESGFATTSSRAGNSVGWLSELAELLAMLADEPWEAGIRRTYTFRAAPERVWRAFADRDEFKVWWGGSDPVEIRAGAEGWWEWPTEGRFAVAVDVVEPLAYIAWRWAVIPDTPLAEADEVLRTEWAFEAREDGGTDLHLLETGFRGPLNYTMNNGGWDSDVEPRLRRHLGETERA